MIKLKRYHSRNAFSRASYLKVLSKFNSLSMPVALHENLSSSRSFKSNLAPVKGFQKRLTNYLSKHQQGFHFSGVLRAVDEASEASSNLSTSLGGNKQTLKEPNTTEITATEIAICNNICLKNVKFVGSYQVSVKEKGQFFKEKVDIQTGVVYKLDVPSGEYSASDKFRVPLCLNPSLKPRYYANIAAVTWGLERGKLVNESTMRLIEVDINIGSVLNAPLEQLGPNAKWYLTSPLQQLSFIWDKLKNSEGFFIVGDGKTNVSLLLATGDKPPYRQITTLEALQVVDIFIKKIFSGILPPFCQNANFLEQFLVYLITEKAISVSQFRKVYEKVGVPFENTFAHIPKGSTSVELLPYSKELVVTQEPIPSTYVLPKIDGNQIVLSENCKLFLENLCINNPYFYSVVRGVIRNVVLSRYEGKLFQSALWLCGPPACCKSGLVRILKKLVPPDNVIEFAHNITNFTGGSLKGKDLIIFSDVTGVSPTQFKMIKPLLGRDQIRGEVKYDPEVYTLEPHAVIVFVSNLDPTQIPVLRDDPAVLNKLIIMKYPAESELPQALQLSNLPVYINRYLPEILNWAIHAPKSVILNQIRAVNYNSYLKGLIPADSIGGLPGYLRDYYLYVPDPGDHFLNITDIKTHLEQMAVKSGDDILNDLSRGDKRKITNAYLGSLIERAVKENFGRSASYGRYSRKAEHRPTGFANLTLKPNKDSSLPFKAEPFEFRFEEAKIVIDDPFYAAQQIVWLENGGLDEEIFVENQREIKRHRDAKLFNKPVDYNLSNPLTEGEVKLLSTPDNNQITADAQQETSGSNWQAELLPRRRRKTRAKE